MKRAITASAHPAATPPPTSHPLTRLSTRHTPPPQRPTTRRARGSRGRTRQHTSNDDATGHRPQATTPKRRPPRRSGGPGGIINVIATNRSSRGHCAPRTAGALNRVLKQGPEVQKPRPGGGLAKGDCPRSKEAKTTMSSTKRFHDPWRRHQHRKTKAGGEDLGVIDEADPRRDRARTARRRSETMC